MMQMYNCVAKQRYALLCVWLCLLARTDFLIQMRDVGMVNSDWKIYRTSSGLRTAQRCFSLRKISRQQEMLSSCSMASSRTHHCLVKTTSLNI
ncbi:hypothetical protein DFH29DRAFT_940700 [Suillus ampliporus]|nr:hypothetical protein DFH29DRAFT_940700 [Suillus ampliporus]